MRVDKWLWNVRIFKSRSKATDACKKGRIRIGENAIKPSALIQVGTTIGVKKDGFALEFVVNELIPRRVSATLAQPCYDNITSEAELNKFKDWFVGKAPSERREKGSGRPTKRERREIDDFKEDYYIEEWLDEESDD